MTTQHDRVFADLLRFVRTAHKQLNVLHETTSKADGVERKEGSLGGDTVRDGSGGGGGDSEGTGVCQPARGQRLGFLPPRLEVPTAALIAGTYNHC